MTLAEKHANQRARLFVEQMGRCKSCGQLHRCSTDMAMAHKVASTKANIRRWGFYRIDHVLNKALVCRETHAGVDCNDRQNIGYKTEQAKALMEKIQEAIAEEDRLRAAGKDPDVLW